MGRAIAALVAAVLVVGLLVWANDATTTHNNITCVRQTTVVGEVKYYLCIAGQSRPQYVPYSTWRSARVGGYYDEGTHTTYKTVDEDPHVSHGLGGEGGEGGGHGFGGGEGGHGGGGR
jgi:uncharacterized membrane protein YgcG